MNYAFINGTILTMDESCPKAEAVLTEKRKIVKCGTQEEILSCKKEDTVLVDLQGKTMLPGFIDGHSHFSGPASALSQCDLSKAGNFQDIPPGYGLLLRLKLLIERHGKAGQRV